ncbi:zinc finger and BTB domain-containing protein 7C-like [Belonocnema kinseyi]|uniref:zinc finger and BTB domain-containing protein 7C-like n=1 Tax=Belonocnema kinseyi TaxID=2817044 RepID=UPI00143DAFA0|nr:zinc finger and BTB domain-containing protein 7C-like [Belonocnema kinseyi]
MVWLSSESRRVGLAKSTLRVRKHRIVGEISYIHNEDEDADDEDEGREVPVLQAVGEEEIRVEMEPENFQEVLEEIENPIAFDESPSNSDSDSEESNSSTDYEDGFEDGILEVVEDEPNEVKQLREWAITNEIEQNDVDQLLKILRRRLLPELPKSAKTFLGTSSAKYNIRELQDADGCVGEYVYF